MPASFRRVVTGHDAAGKSIFIIDGPTPHVFSRSTGSAIMHEMWETTGAPADNGGSADAIARGARLAPPQNGSLFRIIEYPPDAQRLPAIVREQGLPDDSGRAAASDRNNPRHPGFHKTSTIDYAIVLSGEIYAMMDEGELLLKAGDVLVQRGTNHAWSNRTSETVAVAFVLIDAKPT